MHKARVRARMAAETNALDELQLDKAWLIAGAETLDASAEVIAVFRAAIEWHCQGLGGRTEYMDQDYPPETVVEAARAWTDIERMTVSSDNLTPVPRSGRFSYADGGLDSLFNMGPPMVGDNLRVARLAGDSDNLRGDNIGARRGPRGGWESTVNLKMMIFGKESNFFIHPPNWGRTHGNRDDPTGMQYDPAWLIEKMKAEAT